MMIFLLYRTHTDNGQTLKYTKYIKLNIQLLVAKLPKIINYSDGFNTGNAFIINNVAICSIKHVRTPSQGQHSYGIQLPVNYKNLNYMALANTDSQVAIYVMATPSRTDEVSINDLGGVTTQYQVNLITIGEI